MQFLKTLLLLAPLLKGTTAAPAQKASEQYSVNNGTTPTQQFPEHPLAHIGTALAQHLHKALFKFDLSTPRAGPSEYAEPVLIPCEGPSEQGMIESCLKTITVAMMQTAAMAASGQI